MNCNFIKIDGGPAGGAYDVPQTPLVGIAALHRAALRAERRCARPALRFGPPPFLNPLYATDDNYLKLLFQ